MMLKMMFWWKRSLAWKPYKYRLQATVDPIEPFLPNIFKCPKPLLRFAGSARFPFRFMIAQQDNHLLAQATPYPVRAKQAKSVTEHLVSNLHYYKS